MIVAVTGGRDYADYTAIQWALDRLNADVGIHKLVMGDAKGADLLAATWAENRRVPWTSYMADWKGEGRSAGPKRNKRILAENPDVLVAFPGGRGTANMVKQAEKKGIRVLFYRERNGRRELVEKIDEDGDWFEDGWLKGTYQEPYGSPWEQISKDESSLWDADEGNEP